MTNTVFEPGKTPPLLSKYWGVKKYYCMHNRSQRWCFQGMCGLHYCLTAFFPPPTPYVLNLRSYQWSSWYQVNKEISNCYQESNPVSHTSISTFVGRGNEVSINVQLRSKIRTLTLYVYIIIIIHSILLTLKILLVLLYSHIIAVFLLCRVDMDTNIQKTYLTLCYIPVAVKVVKQLDIIKTQLYFCILLRCFWIPVGGSI